NILTMHSFLTNWLIFRNLLSKRKRVDHNYYLEMTFIENTIIKNNVKINWLEIKQITSKEWRNVLDKFNFRGNFKINIDANNLIIDEYWLRWNLIPLTGNIRNWAKVWNYCQTKTDLMYNGMTSDLFYNNQLQLIEWDISFKFL